jgi:hypothetical protein
MSNTCVAAEILLTTQIDKVLRRSRALQRRPQYRSAEAQRMARLLCDELDALVCAEFQPDRASD